MKKENCTGTFYASSEGMMAEREWVVNVNNYDNIIIAFLVFF